jgi:hypothetical protein
MTAMTWPARIVWCGADLGEVDSHQEGTLVIARYQAACVGEGICPVHREWLEPLPAAGFCRACSKVWYANEIEVGWDVVDVRSELH